MPNEVFECNDFGQNSQVRSSLVVSLQLSVHLDKLHNSNCSSPSVVITADGVHYLYSIGFHMTAYDSTKLVPYLLCCASVHAVCFLPHA